jgi:multiple sugar transport system ATP-binding protein
MAYVTHDQIEAISLADRIAVMRAGRLQQFGTAEAIYERPANIFVAQFIGSPPANLVKGRLRKADGRYILERGSFSLDITMHRGTVDGALKGEEIAAGFRPEDVKVSAAAGRGALAAEVYAVEPLGDETILDLKISDVIVRALVPSEFAVRVGEKVSAAFPVEKVNLFDAGTEKNLFLS